MFGLFIFILIVVLVIGLVASQRSAAKLQTRVDALRYRATENDARIDYYRDVLHRKEEHRRISREEVTQIAARHQADVERAARNDRLRNARDAADAIRARVGGRS